MEPICPVEHCEPSWQPPVPFPSHCPHTARTRPGRLTSLCLLHLPPKGATTDTMGLCSSRETREDTQDQPQADIALSPQKKGTTKSFFFLLSTYFFLPFFPSPFMLFLCCPTVSSLRVNARHYIIISSASPGSHPSSYTVFPSPLLSACSVTTASSSRPPFFFCCPSATAAPGVHISVLQDLLRRADKQNSDLTTAQVCAQVVQPATKELTGAPATRAYLRLVEGQTAADGRTPLVKPATHFVSHAWRYTLATVVATLEELAAEEAAAGRETYFWWVGEGRQAHRGLCRRECALDTSTNHQPPFPGSTSSATRSTAQ